MSTLSVMGKAFLNGYGSGGDYSILFNSLNKSSSAKSFNMFDISGKSSTSNLSANFYSDYASLKNGSYGKLAKTWYAKQASETSEGSSSKTDTDYSELASTISKAAKEVSGYASNGNYGAIDTSGSIFDTAS